MFRRVRPLLSVVSLCVALPTASAQIQISPGTLVGGDQTWSDTTQPYVLVGDLTIPAGVTLTIAAGVTVEVDGGDTQGGGTDTGRTELIVEGTLLTQGSAMAPVRFTSGETSPARQDWYGIRLVGSASTLAGLQVEYAYAALHDTTSGSQISDSSFSDSRYGVQAVGGSPTLTRVDVFSNQNNGVFAQSGAAVTVVDSTIRSCNGGLEIENSTLNISGSIIRDNAGRGIGFNTYAAGTYASVVDHNTIVDNSSYGIYAYEGSGSLTIAVRNNAIVGNGSYGVYGTSGPSYSCSNNLVWEPGTPYYGASAGAGSFVENPLFADPDNGDYRPTSRSPLRTFASDGSDIGALPFDGAITDALVGHLFTNTVLTAAESPHVVTGDLTVEPGVTLTVEPGATVRFVADADRMDAGLDVNRTELRVLGTLVADGTLSANITFESDAASPDRGDWYAIELLGGSTSSLIDYATIRHARNGVRSEAGAGSGVSRTTIEDSQAAGVYVTSGALAMSELVIRRSGAAGVRIENAAPTLTDSQIYDNTSYGLNIQSTLAGTYNISLTSNTIVENGAYGIYAYEGTGALVITVRDSIITKHTSYGIYGTSGPSYSATYNVVWDNGTNFYGASAGTGTLVENPLFVDLINRDLRVTSNSPARQHASDAGDIGAIGYDGSATVGLQGHLYGDVTWGNGPLDVLGDITVEPGVTLTIEAGTEIRFAAGTDSMQANLHTNLTEVRVLGRLVADGNPTSRVRFTSAAMSPSRGDWYGIDLLSTTAATSVEHAEVSYGRVGIRSQSSDVTTVTQTEIFENTQYGIYTYGGATAVFDGVHVHHNGSAGIYIESSAPTVNNAIVHNNVSQGFNIQSLTSGTFRPVINHATVHDNTGYGVYAYEGTGALIVTVRNSMVVSNGNYGIYGTSGPSFTLANNNVWGHGTPYYGASAGANSIASNPQFVNTGLGNYHLEPSSLSIDAADPGTALDHDADGAARPIDGNGNMSAVPDIGAYEFNPSANRWPQADAGTDRVVHSGIAATFDASGSVDPDGTIASYVWDFGDGSSSASGVSVMHTFNGGTDRVVTLTVTDNAGAIDVDTVNVEVNLPPVAEAGPDKYADPGEVVMFNGNGSTDADGTISTYTWLFGDGSQATGQTVSHQYGTGGDYTVTLTIADDDGATATDSSVAHVTGGGGGDTTPPSIVHTPVSNGRIAGRDVAVNVEVTDNTSVQSVTLYHRAVGGGAFSSVVMSQAMGNNWQGSLPGASVVTAGVEYYIQAADSAPAPNTATSPATAPAALHGFTVVPPGPQITHSAVGDGQPYAQPVSVVATVTAPDGVASVTLYYRMSATMTFFSVPMSILVGDTYQAPIPAGTTTGSSVDYYISATDSAMSPNTVTEPGGAPANYQSFTVAPAPGPEIALTAVLNGRPFGAAVQVVAVVTAVAGLDSVSLLYRSGTSGMFTSAAMSVLAGDTYAAQIPASATMGTSVDYYVSATDRATPPSTVTEPAGAPAMVSNFTIVSPSGPTIVHVPIADGQASDVAVAVAATVTAPAGIATVTLYYRATGTTSFTSAAMANTSGDDYAANIPAGAVVAPGVDYYIEAVDSAASPTTVTDPTNGGTYDFTVIPADSDPPEIVHSTVADSQPEAQDVMVSADVTDASGVAIVTLSYRLVGSGGYATTPMSNVGGDTYAGSIPGATVARPGVEYYISATDSANPANDATHPVGAPPAAHSFTVVRTFNVSAGDLIVTEVMADPSGSESLQEWFEIHNTTLGPIDVDGMVFADNGSDSFTVAAGGPLVIAGGGYMVFGRSDDTMVNGGVPVDYVYSGFLLVNTDDEVVIRAGSTEVDAVAYDDGVTFPDMQGHSMSLDPNSLDFSSNDDGASWCLASTMLSGGDFGTPGAANDSCDAPIDETPPTIVHTPIADGQPAAGDVAVTAVITDASGLGTVDVYYRTSGGGAFVAVAMSNVAQDNWQAVIPGPAVTTAGVEYYVRAVDASPQLNEALEPAGAPGSLHSFAVTSTDMVGPTITHTPIADAQPVGQAVSIQASITDPSGVASATLHYRDNSASWMQVALTPAGGNAYAAEIPAAAVTGAGVSYYLAATDTSAAQNLSTLPLAGPAMPFTFTVNVPDEDLPVIAHSPVTSPQAKGVPVTITATVTDPSGVAEVRVYFRAAGTATFLSAGLIAFGDDVYSVEIPALIVSGTGVDYYLEAVDDSDEQNLARDPATAPVDLHTFVVSEDVVVDTDAPAIAHVPSAEQVTPGFGVIIECQITDATGVASAVLHFKQVGVDSFITTPLVREDGTNTFRAQIPGTHVLGTGVEYYIAATDSSASANAALLPATAPQQVFLVIIKTGEGGDGGEVPAPRDGECSCAQTSTPSAGFGWVWLAVAVVLLRRRR